MRAENPTERCQNTLTATVIHSLSASTKSSFMNMVGGPIGFKKFRLVEFGWMLGRLEYSSLQSCKPSTSLVSPCKAVRLLRTAEDVAPWTPSVTSDCKRQLSKSHILADLR